MRGTRLGWCVVGAVLLAGGAGCQLPHQPSPVTVTVVDAETKAPMPAAEVKISDVLTLSAGPPEDSQAQTGADGVAHLRLAPQAGAGIVVEAAAPGHLSAVAETPVGDLPDGDWTKPWQATARPPVDVTVEVFAEPRPKVDLVVPAGFLGPIRAVVKADDAAAAGRRAFTYSVEPTGDVTVAGPPVLKLLMPRDVRAKYAAGGDVPYDLAAKEWEVAFRWVKTIGATQYFFVGTRRDCDDYRRSLDPAAPATGGRSGGGPGGGGGGRGGGMGGRRGGMGGGMGGMGGGTGGMGGP